MREDAPSIYRRRANELRKIAETLTAMMRDDLLKVAAEWERLADQAEMQQSQSKTSGTA